MEYNNNDGINTENVDTTDTIGLDNSFDSSSENEYQEQEAADIEVEQGGDENADVEVDQWKDGDPLHKNPRFKEIIKSNQELKRQNEELLNRFTQFEQSFQKTQQAQNPGSNRLSDIEDTDPVIGELLELLPEREYREQKFDERGKLLDPGYQSFKDLAQEIRKNVIKDIFLMNEHLQQKNTAVSEELNKVVTTQIKSIESSFKNDPQGLQQFNQWVAKADQQFGGDISIDKLHKFYMSNIYKPSGKQNIQKNIETSSRLLTKSNNQTKDIPLDKLSNMSLLDVALS